MSYPTYREAATNFPQETRVTTPPNTTAGVGGGGGVIISGGTSSQFANSYTFSDSNNVSFGLSGNIITASASFMPVGAFAISGGTQSLGSGTLIFSNSNSISFGINNSTLTASISYPTQTAYVFNNGHGVTFGTNGSTITASVAGAAIASSVVFSNSNNVSFGLVGSTLTASASYNQSVQTQGTLLVKGSSGDISFANSNGISFGGNNSTITASYTVPTLTEYVFSASHGIAFGTNGSTVTASYTVPSVTNSSLTISAGTRTETASEIVFSNASGVSFGLTGGTITASVKTDYQSSGNYLTSQSNQALSAGNGSFTFQTGSFADSNGVSFSTGTQGIFATVKTDYQTSGAYLTTQSAQVVSAANGSYNFQTLSFSNANGLSFGTSAGSAITASYTVPIQTAYVFSNSNNVSFGTNASTVTATASFNQTNQTIGLYALGNTTQNSSTTLDVRTISLNGLGGATVGYSNGSVQLSVPVTSSLSATGNISISVNGSTISIGAPVQTNQTLGIYAISNTTQSSSGTLDGRSLSFQGAGIVSVGYSNGSVIVSASAAGAADGYNILAAGTQTANTTGTVSFANSNGITFGMSNSSIITASHNALTSQSNQALSGSNGSFTFQTASFMSTHGATFYTSTDGMRLSYTVPSIAGLLSAINLSAGTTSNNLSAITFSNANGFSFGLNASVVTASYTVPTVTNSSWTVSDAATSVTVGRLAFTNSNGLTLSLSTSNNGNHTVIGSYTVPSIAGLISAVNLSAGTTSNNLTAATFSNSNGVSFGLNGSVITATVATNYQSQGAYLTTAAQSTQTLAFTLSGNSATTNSSVITAGGYVLAGGNGVTLAQSNNTLSFSVATNYQSQGAYLTTAAQSTQTHALSLGGNSGTTNSSVLGAGGYILAGGSNITLSMSNNSLSIHGQSQSVDTGKAGTGFTSAGNNIGLSGTLNTNGLSLSATVAAQTNQTVGLYALGNTTQNSSTTLDARTLSFNGLGIITAGYSNGSIQLSATQSNQNISLFALGNTTQNSSTVLNASALSFNGLGNATVGFSNGSIQVSVTAAGGAGITNINLSAGTTSNNLSAFVFSNSNNVSFGLSGSTVTATATVPAQTNQTLGLYALGNTTQNSSTTLDARTVSYNGLGAMTVGYSNGSVQLSAPATSSLSATGAVSISVNGSTISIGAPQMATLSRFEYPDEAFTLLSTIGQGSLSFNRIFIPFNVTGSAAQIVGSITATAAGSTGTQNMSLWMGLYTLNGSNLSLASSGSANNSFQVSSGAPANSTNYVGIRQLTVPMNFNITPGIYWVGAVVSTGTSGTACNLGLSLYGNSLVLSSGPVGVAAMGVNTSAGRSPFMMQGLYTAATAAGPSVVSTNGINMTSAGNQMRANFYVQLYNATY